MELTVTEAAAVLGKSARTVRHLVKQGKIPGRRVGNRWLIDREALSATFTHDADARRERVRELEEHVAKALDDSLPAGSREHGDRRHYSVSDLRAFQHGKEVLAELDRTIASTPSLAAELREARGSLLCCLRALTEGSHQFHADLKLECFLRARTTCCACITDLLTVSAADHAVSLAELADRLERDLLGALRGLLRRAERRRR
ncbi:MAG: helix-turn-helix domain-containing protein [Acidobacteriota bacterium]